MRHRTGIAVVLLALRLHLTVAWTAVSGRFNIDFDQYDLEMMVSGVRQFDIHGANIPRHMEFNTDSVSSTFAIEMPCSVSGYYISNVPVPASNERVWRLKKTSSQLLLYCEKILVGHFSRTSSSLSCLTDDQWRHFGQNLFFNDDAVTHYQLVLSE